MNEQSSTSTFPRDEILQQVLNKVIHERIRQIESEGYNKEVDDLGDPGRLAAAAACYSIHSSYTLNTGDSLAGVPDWWPFAREHWKPKDVESNLIRSAALIFAELERIYRSKVPAAPPQPTQPPSDPGV